MPAKNGLLREIEKWHSSLALETPAAKTIIDGLVFLRLCELKGVGCFPPLSSLLERGQTWPGLQATLRRAEKSLGCELLGEIPPVALADRTLQPIIEQLLHTPLPSGSFGSLALLGQIHERFLGIASPSQASAWKRRANGVYFTPLPVIETILGQTVSCGLQECLPSAERKLKILDPACGGGAFLLGALDLLFEWYGEPPSLSPQVRARIALDHIHGVDLDEAAVHVTRRALILKVFEGAGEDIFPLDWSRNIKRGNALIEPDFYDHHRARRGCLTKEQQDYIGAFCWQQEFRAVMENGGFDAVIGNPPYSNYSSRDSQRAKYEQQERYEELQCFDLSREYCVERYSACSHGTHDAYKWFTARALELTRSGGHFGFILPNTWLTHSKYADLKCLVAEAAGDMTVIDLGSGVFPVVVPTCIVTTRKGTGTTRRFADVKHQSDKWAALQENPFEELDKNGDRVGHALVQKFIHAWPAQYKMKAWLTLREGSHIERCRLQRGCASGTLPVIDSKNMGRYCFDWQPQFCFINTPGPGAFKPSSGERIIVRKTGDSIVAALTPPDEAFVLQNLYLSTGIGESVVPEFLLGLLNSKFLTFLYQHAEFGQKGRVLAQFRKGHLDKLPVPPLDLSRAEDRTRHDKLAQLVTRRLSGEAEAESSIDALVYELYQLSQLEIEIIEEGHSGNATARRQKSWATP